MRQYQSRKIDYCPPFPEFRNFVQERDYVLNSFKSGRMPIMCATDVAARGLDVKDVAAVVNYDFPNGVEDYIHRIGRTGRAGASG